MRHLGIATFAVGILLATTALAQDRHNGGHPGGGAPHMGGGAPHVGGGMPHGGGTPHGGGVPHGGGIPHGGGMSRGSFESGQRSFGGTRTEGHIRGGVGHGATHTLERHESRGLTTEHSAHVGVSGGTHDSRGFGARPSNWNNRPRTFNRAGYQRNFNASHRFHYGSYHRPAGWYYRRWTYGEYLPSAFWARDYWLTDWWLFDLPIPPYGYEWVRYGDDALLINIYNGEILEVEYSVFY